MNQLGNRAFNVVCTCVCVCVCVLEGGRGRGMEVNVKKKIAQSDQNNILVKWKYQTRLYCARK